MPEMKYDPKKRKETVELAREEYHGYTFIVVNCRHDHPCGYVVIPKGHKYYKIKYSDIPIDCHGGLTYGSHYNPSTGIEDENWYIGWDYAHLGDHTADDELFGKLNQGHRYSTADVIEEAHNVIDQLNSEVSNG